MSPLSLFGNLHFKLSCHHVSLWVDHLIEGFTFAMVLMAASNEDAAGKRMRVCKTEAFVPNGAHLIPSGAHLKLAMEVVRVLLLLTLSSSCNALIERLYCGKHNCYECECTAS